MKILILGGRRYLGPRLVKRLIDCGHEPVLFHRGRTNAPLPVEGPIREVIGDRNQQGVLEELVAQERFDAVVDTLAFDAAGAERAITVFDGRIDKYLVISSVACYGRLLHVPANENHPYVDDTRAFPMPSNEYSVGKRDVEQVMLAAYQRKGFPVIIIRPSVSYGYGRLFSIWGYSSRHVSRIRAGKQVIVPDTGEGLIQPVFIDDEAAIVERALVTDAAVGQAFNCAGPVAVPLWEYFSAHGTALGRPVQCVEIPSLYLEGFDPMLCVRASQNLVFNHAYDVSKLERVLRFQQFTSLEDGLRHTIAFQDQWGLIEPSADDPDDWIIDGYNAYKVIKPRQQGEQLRRDRDYQLSEKSPLVTWAPDQYSA